MNTAPIDVVYPLAMGSRWHDNELRYSLRSVCKHLPHARVIVLGMHPPWLTGVGYLPVSDRFTMPVRNTLAKLEALVNSDLVGPRFVWMNDDIFLLHAYDPDAPMVVTGTLAHHISAGAPGDKAYTDVLESGLSLRHSLGIAEPLNYDTHHPLVMETAKVKQMLARFGGEGSLYPWRTVYGNMHRVPAQVAPDVKQRRNFRMPRYGDAVLSIDDGVAEEPCFQQWCTVRWPEASPYEQQP